MEIRETRQRNLKLLEEEIQISKKGIQFVKNNLNPLGDEPDQEEEGKGIDPARFMTRREEKEWNRLSGHKQAQFIKSGTREAGTHQPREAAEKISSVFREGNIQQELAGRKDYAGHMYGPAKNPFAGRNVKESRVTRADQIQKERRGASGTEKQHGPPETPRAQERQEKGAEHFSPVGKAPPEISGSQGSFSTVNSAAFTGTKTEGMAAASGSASSKNAGKGGAGIAAAAAKKTAEVFQEALAARAMAAQQAQQRSQTGESFGTLQGLAAYAGTTLTTGLASLAAIVLHMVSTLVTALLAMVASILPLIAVLCTVVVIIVSILSALTSSNSAGYDLPAFVTEDMMEAFFEVQEESGIPVSSGVAQLIAESGFGLYGPGGESGEGLSKLAYDHKNLFGIKYFSGDQYASGAVDMTTGEEFNGGYQETTAGFSVYPDYAACIRQRAWMLLREPYAGQVSAYLNQNDGKYQKEDAENFIRGIRAAGWATSSSYVTRCIQLMEQYGLYQFDNMNYEDYKSGLGGGGPYDGTITPSMRQIVDVAKGNTGTYPCTPDMCAAWVTGVYQAAGAPALPYGNAIDMWNTYKGTGGSSMENIPPGAIVCGSGSGYMGSLYGHVGVYLGDGMVAHNAGYHSIQTLEEWCAWQTAVCQGHQGWIGWVFPGGVPME